MPLPKDNLLFGFELKLTDEQRIYVNSIFDYQMTIVNARSGTGKTSLAVACSKLIGKDLIYIFAPIQEGTMGFRPGSQEEKESAYIQPLKDALIEINENPTQVIYREDSINDPKRRKEIMDNIKYGKIWVYPKSHVFARGINIRDKTVIIDEAQNFKKSELKKVLSRIHDSCKVILIGHSGQCDLDNPKDSGFEEFIEHFKNEDYVNICELTWNFRGRLAHHADQIK